VLALINAILLLAIKIKPFFKKLAAITITITNIRAPASPFFAMNSDI